MLTILVEIINSFYRNNYFIVQNFEIKISRYFYSYFSIFLIQLLFEIAFNSYEINKAEKEIKIYKAGIIMDNYYNNKLKSN